MKVSIPERNRLIVQRNNSNALVDSNVVRTWNIDVTTEPGTLMASPRTYINTDNSDDADLGLPVAFAFEQVTGKYYAVCGAALFKTAGTDPSAAFTQDAATNTPTTSPLYSDIRAFGTDLYVTTATDVAKLDPGTSATWDHDWWTTTESQAALKSNRPHPMETLQIGSPVLCIGDGNLVHTVTSGGVVTNSRLVLDENQVVVWIKTGTSRAYIGCVSTTGNDAYVYEWDGGDTVATYAFNDRTAAVLAGAVINDTLYVINSNGELQTLDRGGFVTRNQFPIARNQVPLDNASFIYSNRRFIHPNGFIHYKNKLLAHVSLQEDTSSSGFTSIDQNTPAGVWEYDPSINSLSHKYSLTLDDSGALDFGQIAMPCDSSANNRVPGALFETTANKYATPLLIGGSVWTDDATTYKTAIYNLDASRTMSARAIVEYPKVYTTDAEEAMIEFVSAYERMKSATDKIIFKYRVEEDPNLPLNAAVTWTSNTVFTSTASGFANAAKGHEVEIIMGNGSGTTAHIASISEAAGTYTVTLDEAITGISANDKNYVRVTNYKKHEAFTDQIGTTRIYRSTTNAATWFQPKVELRSTSGGSPALERLIVRTVEHRR